MVSPSGGAVRDLGAPTINTKKHGWWDPWEAVMKIQERPPSMLKMSMVGPLGFADGDTGALTINAKEHQWRSPSEVLPKIRERLPSTLKNVDGRPPGSRGGFGLQSGSVRCVVNLHRYDRQKVILLMGLILPALILVMAYNP
jgi:hypothetical protein